MTKQTNFKFHTLRFFNWDNVVNSKKIFRQLFDSKELTYLGVELSFYNKRFDEEDWETAVSIKGYSMENDKKKKQVCGLDENVSVSKEENLITVDKGWGDDVRGKYWQKGDYLFEAYIGDELVASEKCYIETIGIYEPGKKNWFSVKSLRVFEGPNELLEEKERKYLRKFNGKETRYVWGEFTLENHAPESWLGEFFFNYFDDTGQLIGRVPSLEFIPENSAAYTVCHGWGSMNPDTFKHDDYTLEIEFQEQVLAIIPYSIGSKTQKAEKEELILNPYHQDSRKQQPKKEEVTDETDSIDPVIIDNEEEIDEAFSELDKLIGLDEIKEQIRKHVKYLKFLKIRKNLGYDDQEEIVLHGVFTGNPGTGKTTVARILGRIYKALGILERGHLVECDSSDLIAGFLGQTAIKTKEKIMESMGGVLFIDEAYSLMGGDHPDFGQKAVSTLLKLMEDQRGEFAVIVAGYPKPMESFIESNPGLKSRFDYTYDFPDFSDSELEIIAENMVRASDMSMTNDAREHLYTYLQYIYSTRNQFFGNARSVRKIIERIVRNQHIRMASMTPADRKHIHTGTIILDDVREFMAGPVQQTSGIGFKFGVH